MRATRSAGNWIGRFWPMLVLTWYLGLALAVLALCEVAGTVAGDP